MILKRTQDATWRWIGSVAVAGVLMLVVAFAAAHVVTRHAPQSSFVGGAEAAASEGNTPFHEHVAKAGVTTCREAFPAMGKLLTQGSKYMVQSQWNKQNPEQSMMQALIGMQLDTPNYKGPAVGYMMVAPAGNVCEASLIKVTPFEKSCDEVSKAYLGKNATAAPLQGLPTYTLADGGQVVTVPMGKNCIAVSVGHSVVSSKSAH